MLKTVIVDGYGDGQQVKVEQEGTLNVVVHPHPPQGMQKNADPFRQYFTDSGLSTGSNVMKVDGSSLNVEFYINAVPEYDIYIKSISVVIGDGGSPALNKFGALVALTNGIEWSLFTQELGGYILHDGIKTNLEFIRLAVDTAGIGTGVDAFLADVSGGATEKSYLPNIDMAETFGLAYGVRLRKGTTDRLIFTVRDDLTGLTTHNAIGYGIRI